MHKYCFEALDRRSKDVMQCVDRVNQHIPFDGKVVVFTGDLNRYCMLFPKEPDMVVCSRQSTTLTYEIFVMCYDNKDYAPENMFWQLECA